MGKSKIEWTAGDDGALGMTWNPVRGCSRISAGCQHCYAERQAARFSYAGQYAHGFVERTASGPRWTGRVELVPSKLAEPLSWKKPRRVFVNSMSDLFHESLPFAEIDKVFAVMAAETGHTFQVLTKRADRMQMYMSGHDGTSHIVAAQGMVHAGQWPPKLKIKIEWPLKNVWLGVSVEDQPSADERIPLLLATPAAVRFVSAEPLLEAVNLRMMTTEERKDRQTAVYQAFAVQARAKPPSMADPDAYKRGLDWVIVGGESGPGARQCDVAWIRSIVRQCKAAGARVFVKQLGANVIVRNDQCADWIEDCAVALDDVEGMFQGDLVRVHLFDKKGGDPAKWPSDLRVRQFPKPNG